MKKSMIVVSMIFAVLLFAALSGASQQQRQDRVISYDLTQPCGTQYEQCCEVEGEDPYCSGSLTCHIVGWQNPDGSLDRKCL